MKNISIYTFINIVFLITFISVVALFSIFIKLDQQKFQIEQQNQFDLISNSFLSQLKHHPTNDEIITLSNKLNLSKIENRDENINILKQAIVIYQKELNNSRVRIFSLKNKHYIYIQSIGYNLMFELYIQKNYNFYIAIIILTFISFLLLFLYMALNKKLNPLSLLNQKITQFSNGDLNIKIDIDSTDEIGKISSSFNIAIENINTLINSKNLFMKNIIHELKTPITKGLIVANMIETNSNEDKELLIKSFTTLNTIINQLSNIEKLKTLHLQIKKEKINIDDTITQILSILDIKHDEIKLDIENIAIYANKDLFGTMLKNLIDNAYKYNTTKPIKLEIKNGKIIVKSKGVKLQKPLSHYTQAFVQEKKNNHGFGLGLYIVNEIAKLHNFKLTYFYEDGYNIFVLNIQS